MRLAERDEASVSDDADRACPAGAPAIGPTRPPCPAAAGVRDEGYGRRKAYRATASGTPLPASRHVAGPDADRRSACSRRTPRSATSERTKVIPTSTSMRYRPGRLPARRKSKRVTVHPLLRDLHRLARPRQRRKARGRRPYDRALGRGRLRRSPWGARAGPGGIAPGASSPSGSPVVEVHPSRASPRSAWAAP
jgi:hypothetical protein